jgi:hypothetical protein
MVQRIDESTWDLRLERAYDDGVLTFGSRLLIRVSLVRDEQDIEKRERQESKLKG